MKFEGIYTPVITPFGEDASIDFQAWSEVLEAQIAGGVHGIIVGGSTGEFYALTQAERLEQFRFANEQIAGRVPWIAGVNDLRAEMTFQYAEAARDAGADALLVAAPPYSLPSEEELAEHCLKLRRVGELPIILYNYPGRTGVGMGREFLERISCDPGICAIKESSGDLSRIHLLAREFPQLQLSAGAEDQVLEFFVWGAKSWVSASANFFPKLCVGFYETCVLKKDFEKGRQIMSALLPLMSILEQGGKFLQCVKYACKLQGISGGPVRPPLLPMGDGLRREMDEVVVSARDALESILD